MSTKKEALKKSVKKVVKKAVAKKPVKKETTKKAVAKKEVIKKPVVKKEVVKQNEIKAQIIAKNLVTMINGKKIVLKTPSADVIKTVTNKIKLYNKKNSDILLTEILAIIDVKETEKEVKKGFKKGLEKVLKSESKKAKDKKAPVSVVDVVAAVTDNKVEEETKAKVEEKVVLTIQEMCTIEQASIRENGRPNRRYKHPVTGRTWDGEKYK